MGLRRLEMKVIRTICFSHISSVIRTLASSFWRTWNCFVITRRVTLAVEICPCALNQKSRTITDGDVGGHLLPCALLSRLSGTVNGFSIATSLSRRLCSSHAWFAAYLPNLSKDSIASFPLSSLTGTSSAERKYWCAWRAGLIWPAVLNRQSRSTRRNSVGANIIGATLLRSTGWVFGGVERQSGKTFFFHFLDNPWHFDGRYRIVDWTRHDGHQWLLGRVLKSRRARLHAPHYLSQHWLRWSV